MIPENKSKKKGPLGDGPKLPKFNIYWIYGILFSILLYATFFSKMAPDVNVISHNEFAKLMASGDVEKYVKVENKKVVRIYIKADSLQKEYYVQKFKTKLNKEKIKGNYLFEYKVDDWSSFNKEVESIYTKYAITDIPDSSSDTENDWFGPIANTIFSLVLIVVVWVLLMRKMGGGAGGSQRAGATPAAHRLQNPQLNPSYRTYTHDSRPTQDPDRRRPALRAPRTRRRWPPLVCHHRLARI